MTPNEDPDVLWNFEKFLVDRAGNGCEALDKIRASDCDIVLLDIEMPRMNGLEALKHLRLISKAKVIVVSSSAQAGSRISAACTESFCLTRPSLETAASTPRPPTSVA